MPKAKKKDYKALNEAISELRVIKKTGGSEKEFKECLKKWKKKGVISAHDIEEFNLKF